MAVGGARVVIELLVRRFRCSNGGCRAITFAEQVPGLTRPHSRCTPMLEEVLTAIGLALAGRARGPDGLVLGGAGGSGHPAAARARNLRSAT
jgi:hypothetical protein